MRRTYILASIVGALFAVSSYFTYAVSATFRTVYDICVVPLRADYGVAWQFVNSFKLVAYRVVGTLRPVYRDSYATDGLSLTSMRFRA
jgi:hypothetical protein